MTVYRWLFDHALVRVDAETAHRAGFGALRAGRPVLRGLDRFDHRRYRGPSVHALGIEFPGVLGLAAGFDKNAEGIDALAALGFGFVEIGTVTPRPQAGNPAPRMFRLPRHRALINRLGFNNDGVHVLVRNVEGAQRREGPLGINIGKNKDTPN